MKKIIILAFLGFAIASCGQTEETVTSNKEYFINKRLENKKDCKG